MRLNKIADLIDCHLNRMARDPSSNPVTDSGLKKFYQPSAIQGGTRIFVTNTIFRSATSITRAQAEAYLEWLNSGNNGTIWDMERSQK